MRGRQFTGQGLNLNDEIWGKKSGGYPDEHALLNLRYGRERSVCAIEKQLYAECPIARRFRGWPCHRPHGGSFWLFEPENTATYILRRVCAVLLPRQTRA